MEQDIYSQLSEVVSLFGSNDRIWDVCMSVKFVNYMTERSMMAQWLKRAPQGHKMEVMVSNSGRVKPGVRSPSI